MFTFSKIYRVWKSDVITKTPRSDLFPPRNFLVEPIKVQLNKTLANTAIEFDRTSIYGYAIYGYAITESRYRTGVPKVMQFSSVRTKSLSLGLMTCKLFTFSIFLIHLLAWDCGSIIRGQRRAFLFAELAALEWNTRFASRIFDVSMKNVLYKLLLFSFLCNSKF